MTHDDDLAAYLESGAGPVPDGGARLDALRHVLAEPATWAEPPHHIRERLLAQVEEEAFAGHAKKPSSGWPGLVAAVGVAAAMLALVWSTAVVLASRSETVVALTGVASPISGEARLRPTGSGWWIRLEVAGLPPAPEGSYYQGWVWDEQGTGVPIGTFHMRSEEPVILWAGVDLGVYRRISVTLEAEEDGPEPSQEVVLRGEVDWAP